MTGELEEEILKVWRFNFQLAQIGTRRFELCKQYMFLIGRYFDKTVT